MMDGVEHAARTVGRAKCPLRRPARTVPQDDIAALFLREPAHDVVIEIGTDGAAEPQRLVVGKHRRLEASQASTKKAVLASRIGIRFHMGQLLQAPPLDLAPGPRRAHPLASPRRDPRRPLTARAGGGAGVPPGIGRGVPRFNGQWRENSSNAGPKDAR